MGRWIFWSVVVVGWWVFGLAGVAQAAVEGVQYSVECDVAEADVAVVGRLVSAEVVASPSATVPSYFPWTKATVEVEEVIAGKAEGRVTFWVEGEAEWARWTWWRHPRMLVCLKDAAPMRLRRGKRYPIYDAVDYLGWSEMSLEEEEIGRIIAASKSPFRTTAEVLAAVRPYGKRPLKIDVTGIRGLEVPVDATEERYAEEWARRGDDDWAAVLVLIERKTAASTVALRALAMRGSDEPGDMVMRAVAASELASRGEKATVWRSPRDGWGMLWDWSWWVAAGIGVGVTEVVRRRTEGGRLRRGVAMGLAGTVGLLLGLWLHSYFGGDAFAWGHWRLEVVRGEVTWAWVNRADVRIWPGLEYGRPAEVQFAVAAVYWEPWHGIERGHTDETNFPLTDYPYWEFPVGYRMPLWPIVMVTPLPVLAWLGAESWRRGRQRGRRGFPISVGVSGGQKGEIISVRST